MKRPRRPAASRRSTTRPVRRRAESALERVLAAHAPAEPVLESAGRGLDERDRRLLAQMVYGALRWLRRIDHVVARAAERDIAAIDVALLPVLRVAAAQLLALDRVPAHAAVSEAVDEARRRRGRGAAGFVNAVLRRIAAAPCFEEWPVECDDPLRKLAIESSHPDLLIARWWNRYGEAATRRIAAASNEPRSMHLLAFAARGGRDRLARELAEEGVTTRASSLSPLGLVVEAGHPLSTPSFAGGRFYVQDEASQAAALVPPPSPGERVFDAAAAPGGKGLALLAAEPGARVLFADGSRERMRTLTDNLRRLDLEAWRIVADARRPAVAGCFDRVLLDAPCTGTGTLRRHPELRWRFRVEELERLARQSSDMLAALAGTVRRGGILHLVTCSIESEENEAIVERFLARTSGFERVDLSSLALPPDTCGDPPSGLWKTLPGDGHDGFSVHILRRVD